MNIIKFENQIDKWNIVIQKLNSYLKVFEKYIMIFLTFFIFFAVLAPFTIYADDDRPSYVTDDGALYIPAMYEENREIAKIMTDEDQPNVASTGSTWDLTHKLSFAWSIGFKDIFAATPNQKLAVEQLPFGVRYGLVGLTTINADVMAHSYPSVDIPTYLAYEWVPGKQSYRNVYASRDIDLSTGYGFLTETGIVQFWQVTRNLAYMILAIILILSGFMIMFRQKVNGQVMVSVFNTLPNIILAMVLVTFSFAIVGLLIDINSNIIYSINKGIFNIKNEKYQFIDDIGNSPSALTSDLTNSYSIFVTDTVLNKTGRSNLPNWLVNIIENHPKGFVITTSTLINIFATYIPLLGPLKVGADLIMDLMILLSLLTIHVSLKIYFAILKQYLSLLLNIIIFPLTIAFSALPGNSKSMWNTLKKIIKNLLSMQLITFFVNLAMVLFLTTTVNLHILGGVGIASGVIAHPDTGSSILVRIYVFFYVLYYAAQSPYLLDDWIKTENGKGVETASSKVKIPLVGSLFKSS